MSINSVSISGNITRDAMLTETVNGSYILKFSVAVNDRKKNKDGQWDDYASFIDCVMFGKRAESLSKYVHKGTKVAIQGKLNQDRWKDKNSGESRSKIVVFVDEIELMSRREAPTQSNPAYEDDSLPF